jgi:hypothetical protein
MHGLERMRLFRAVALVTGAFVLLVHAAMAQSVTPYAVVDSYERAWGQHDVEGALALLADNAVITLQDPRPRSLTGQQQIREYLQSVALQSPPQVTMSRQVDGNQVIWSERLDRQVTGASEVTVHAVVEDGKITSLVYRMGRLVRGPGNSAVAVTTASPGAILGAIVLFGFGLLSLAGVRSRVRSGSNLRGRLMTDLRLWRALPRTSS